ncbi:MAG TPA: hypothetical protein VIL55_14200 [Naasia sp.]
MSVPTPDPLTMDICQHCGGRVYVTASSTWRHWASGATSCAYMDTHAAPFVADRLATLEAELDEVRGQRDRARSLAARLEAEVAALTDRFCPPLVAPSIGAGTAGPVS